MTRLDPFVDAVCRSRGRPSWWDVDASVAEREAAAGWCQLCPAATACADAAAALGAVASGTWAGTYHDWPSQVNNADDDTLAEFLSVFGPSAAHTDFTQPEIVAAPTKYGKHWLHPAQTFLDFTPTRTGT